MAVTLEQAKLGMQDDLQIGVIDEFRKSNFLFNNLTFDDVVSPTGGGGAFTYTYNRLVTQPTADFRAINKEYTPSEVTHKPASAELKVFGGSFEIDRVIANAGGIVDRTALQINQKAKATSALFNDTVINGDNAVNANSFDGLEKMVTGSTTEYVPTTVIDLSTSELVTKNYLYFLDLLDEFLTGLDGVPSFIGGNTKLISKIRAVARRVGMHTTRADEFGKQVDFYGNIPLVDFGAKAGTNDPVAKVSTDTATKGETSLYVARLGLDGFHAVSMQGQAPVKLIMPDFSTAGAVKKGEVEMISAVALKATKSAGILRKIKVA